MPLEKALVPVDIVGGLDTKTDQFLTPGLTELENGVFTTGSRISKRKGYERLSTTPFGGSSVAFEGMITFKDELLAFGGGKMYSYATGQKLWADRGAYQSVGISRQTIVRQNSDVMDIDVAQAGGTIVYAWEQFSVAGVSEGVFYSVVDSSSDGTLASRVLVSATGKNPRCVKLGSNACIVYAETSGTDSIKSVVINSGDPSSFSSQTLGADIDPSNLWLEVAVYNDDDSGGYGIFAYRTSTANTVKVGYLAQNGAVGGPSTGFAAATTVTVDSEDGLSLACDTTTTATHTSTGEIFLTTWKNSDGSGLVVNVLNTALTSSTQYTIEATSNLIDACGMVIDTNGLLHFIYSFNAAIAQNSTIYTNTFNIATNTVGTAALVSRSVTLSSKPFIDNGVVYFLALYDTPLQPTYFLISNSGVVSAKILSGKAGEIGGVINLSSVIKFSSGIYYVGAQIRTRLVSKDNDLYSLKGLSRLSFDFNTTQFEDEEIGGNLHISGGFIQMYDSTNIVEHGFHVYPEGITAVVAGSGDSENGTWAWACVYRWIDEYGQVHRSEASVPIIKALSSNHKATLTIPTLRLTAKSGVIIDIYRTLNGGTLYFKVGEVLNNSAVDTVTVIDGDSSGGDLAIPWIASTDLVAKESLYTNGGVLGNMEPPATDVLAVFAGRMWSVSAEDPTQLYYSKRRTEGRPVEFSDVFKITLNRAHGVTALYEMDEKLIIFERDEIQYITGTGPTDTGDLNDFSSPKLVTGDVGCTNGASLVLMPLGLMFQSNKGIYMITRGLETVYIGAPVEAYNHLTVTSAELIDDENQIRFLTSEGDCLVYDYYFGKWSVFTNHSGSGAVIWRAVGKYVYLRKDGRIFMQDSSYKDDNDPINMMLTTGWLQTNAVQGLQRSRRAFILGSWLSSHKLKVKIGYNYEQFFNEQHTWDFIEQLSQVEYGDESPFGSSEFGGESNGVYQFRIHLGKQKNQAIRFKIEDIQTNGEAFSLSSLMLEVGLKPTSAKLQAERLT